MQPVHKRRPPPRSVMEVFPDGGYTWACSVCLTPFRERPHRGPRRTACRRCQNLTSYRKRHPLVQRKTRGLHAAWRSGIPF